MKNILILTDFSKNSWNALEYGIKFFEKTNCSFYLLHVNLISDLALGDTPYLPVQETIEDLYIKPSKRQLKELSKKVANQFPDKNHKFYVLTDYGFFIESIRKHVAQKSIDMIIMGTQGATGLKKYIVGSNTGDVITKVKCTTLIVPANATYTPPKEIALPTDFAISYDIQILQPISDILSRTNASLRLLHIGQKADQLNENQKACKELIGDFFEGFEYSYHFLTSEHVEDGVQCFVESRNIDMIAMVAKNLNYFQKILFHSKTEKISYHTNIPFLVLHE